MRTISLVLFLVFVFQACSFKSPENKWEYNSSNSFNSYKTNFLISNDEIAEDDLNRAIKYAKQSANLEQLATIYLGECALNISVGLEENCNKYLNLEELVNSNELNAYYLMLQNRINKEQISKLPKQYKMFSKYKFEKQYVKAFESIGDMEQKSSKFIAASLIKDKLNKRQIKLLIDKASYYGFKKVVLFWLNHLKKIEENFEEKNKISKKIMILESN